MAMLSVNMHLLEVIIPAFVRDIRRKPIRTPSPHSGQPGPSAYLPNVSSECYHYSSSFNVTM